MIISNIADPPRTTFLLILSPKADEAAAVLEAFDRLPSVDFRQVAVQSGQDLTETLHSQPLEWAFFDIDSSLLKPLDLLNQLLSIQTSLNVIFGTREGAIDEAVTLLKQGAADYIQWSTSAELAASLEKTLAEAKRRSATPPTSNETADRFRSILDHQSDLICRFDPQYTFTYVNEAYANWHDSTPEALIGTDLLSRLNDKERANLLKDIGALSADRPTTTGIHKTRLPDGGIRWIEWTVRAIFDENGTLLEVQEVGHDVTSLRNLENERLFHDEILQAIAEGILITEVASQTIVYSNATFDRLFGYPAGYLIGKSPSILNHAEGNLPFDTILEALGRDGRWSGEIQNVRQDGTIFWSKANIVEFTHAHYGDVWISVQEDITEAKKAQLTLKESLEALEKRVDERSLTLREREKLLFEIAENYPSAYVTIIEKDLTIGYTAGRAFKNIRHNPEDFVGLSLEQVFPNHYQLISHHYRRCFQGEEQYFELLLDRQHLEFRAVPLASEDGSISRILVAAHDVTEQKKAEIQVAEERNLLRTVIDLVPDLIYARDTNGEILLSNKAHTDFREELAASVQSTSSGLDIFPEGLRQQISRENRSIYETGRAIIGKEQYLSRPIGKETWKLTSKIPLRNIRNEIIGLVGVTRDITADKRAKLALERSEERFQLAARAGKIGVWDLDVRTGKTVWDERMFTIYDLPKTTNITDLNTWYQKIHPEDLQIMADALLGAVHQNLPFDIDFRIKLQDGRERFIKGYATLILDEHGAPERLVGVNQDITSLKIAERSLLSSLDKERQLGELKSRFISMASHEFRTPLTAIMGSAELLYQYRDRMDSAEIQERLDRIRRQVDHIEGIIEDILQVAKLDEEGVEFRPEARDILAFCEEMRVDFESQGRFAGRIQFSTDNVPNSVWFDQRLMKQAIGNLLSNALKYSEGPVDFELRGTKTGFEIFIRDHGIGIPPEEFEHLFDPFHRANNVGTIAGTGLGLHIAKRAIDAHSGRIEFESSLGKGSTFRVMIPTLEALLDSE